MTFAAPPCFKNLFFAACGFFWLSSACASCKLDRLPLTPAMINDFLQKPEIILSDVASSKRGDRALSISIIQYTAAGPAVIQAIKSILPGATPRQRAAIGEGLYTAVALCRAIDPVAAAEIEKAVKSIDDKDVTKAYRPAERRTIGNSKPNIYNGVTPAKPLGHLPELFGKPSAYDPGSLKLKDPFRPMTVGGDP
jgi:hypothetical protein